jgi:inorganic pyrophosphatase
MILLGEPAFPGSSVTARPVGVFWMLDEHGPDAKILAVPAHDPRYAGLRDLADVSAHLRVEISHFFDVYKELEPGKGTDVRGWQDRAAAGQETTASFERGHGQASEGRRSFRRRTDPTEREVPAREATKLSTSGLVASPAGC